MITDNGEEFFLENCEFKTAEDAIKFAGAKVVRRLVMEPPGLIPPMGPPPVFGHYKEELLELREFCYEVGSVKMTFWQYVKIS